MLTKVGLLLFFALLHIVCCDAQSVTSTKNFIKIESSPANVYWMADTIIINMNAFAGDLRMLSTPPFLLSVDGITRAGTLIIPYSQSNTNIPI